MIYAKLLKFTEDEKLENTARKMVVENGLKAGLAFPTGVNRNECAAHYTPNIGEKNIVQKNDIIKVDYGIHVNGHLIDCAYTVNFNPRLENLRQATIDGTNAGLKIAGPDAKISDISEAIEDTIRSFECEDEFGNPVEIKCVENLNGHQIDQYIIHAGKNVPIVRGNSSRHGRMLAGEQYAIETFATTGSGTVREVGENTHFMAIPKMLHRSMPAKTMNEMMSHIRKQHGTLAFSQRNIYHARPDWTPAKINGCLSMLSKGDQAILREYPPLCDIPGSNTSQMEHTLFIKHGGIEVISRGDDY